jgi:hypothetical protein
MLYSSPVTQHVLAASLPQVYVNAADMKVLLQVELVPIELPRDVKQLRVSAPGPASAASVTTAAAGSAEGLQSANSDLELTCTMGEGLLIGSGPTASDPTGLRPSNEFTEPGDGSRGSSSQVEAVAEVLKLPEEKGHGEEDLLMAALRVNLQVSHRVGLALKGGLQ